MHGVVAYALWRRREFEKAGATTELQRGFDAMPEVRRLLDERLQVASEPSRAVRAVYGRWFPWLMLLDRSWAERSKELIFPPAEDDRPLWNAAWDAYVRFAGPYDSVWPVLAADYRRAIERLSPYSTSGNERGEGDSRLAEHLMVYYLRGVIRLDDPVFVDFWAKAPSKLTAHALSFVGRALAADREPVAAEMLERLRHLWRHRYEMIVEAEREVADDAAAFGAWFTADKFDREWALTELVRALKIAGKVRLEYQVLKKLAEMASQYPALTLEALELLIEGKEPWTIHGRREELRAILLAALRATDYATAQRARQIVHRLGQRGYFDFRDLLAS
jgi:hypothetical protein